MILKLTTVVSLTFAGLTEAIGTNDYRCQIEV